MSDDRAHGNTATPFVMDLACDHLSCDDFVALGAFFDRWGYGTFDAQRFEGDFARAPYGAILVKEKAIKGALLYRIAGDEAEIIELAVHADHRRTSIGSNMLAFLSSHARKNSVIRLILEVAEDNHGAIALYQSAGFAQNGIRPRYYQRYDQLHNQTKIDAIIMELWLSKV